MNKPEIWAVIPAAGSGSRMGTPIKKQFLTLSDGREILAHSLEIFERCPRIYGIVLVTGSEDILQCQQILCREGFHKVQKILPGGKTRQASVLAGLTALPESCDYVAVHDAARPYLTPNDLERVLDDAILYGASLMAVPCKDTIKRADADGFVVETPERSSLWNIQTPQVFERCLLLSAHKAAEAHGDSACTDDGQVVEKYTAQRVHLCSGSYSNIKITTPEDLA